ncbi:GTP-binding domain [Vibrio phage F94]
MIWLQLKTPKEDVTIVCGKAKGADTCEEEWYELHKYEGVQISYRIPDWKDTSKPDAVIKYNTFGAYNAKAGNDRNSEMQSVCTHLLAFWDQKSKETKDMITKIKKSGKPYRVFDYYGNLLEV